MFLLVFVKLEEKCVRGWISMQSWYLGSGLWHGPRNLRLREWLKRVCVSQLLDHGYSRFGGYVLYCLALLMVASILALKDRATVRVPVSLDTFLPTNMVRSCSRWWYKSTSKGADRHEHIPNSAWAYILRCATCSPQHFHGRSAACGVFHDFILPYTRIRTFRVP